jgi:NAD(P)-dependent dehydrogenase (short-subunit alcohol dehydrogenase family)
MELRDRHLVITGAAGGIGSALARRFAAERPRAIVLADVDEAGAAAVAREIGHHAAHVDARREESIRALVDRATEAHGPIDLFFSNAGVTGPGGGPEGADDGWQAAWEINVMAHVRAARALLPGMVERGEGYLVSTASAAGLLAQVDALAYTATKHAAVAVAEWLAINYRDAGVRVSCVCPQAVRTPMLEAAAAGSAGMRSMQASGAVLEPEEAAESVLQGIREERFLILTHPEVARYMQHKATDPERWLEGMRRFVRESAT